MAAHRRSTSDSATTIFVPHGLSFAGAGEEEDKYHAAQRYDWDDVPLKLTEPRAPYELTQPFDYVVPKKAKKSQALGANHGNVNGEAEVGVVRKKIGRPRKDAALAAAEEHTPAHSVEPDATRSQPKRRGRPPRRSEASRKTDDGDNTADESYVQPGETWKAGTKRRGPAPSHPPTKKPRISKTAETDDEHETAPLRSGGARSRVTPLKPQQANRWSSVEDRQLIDSLFEVLGSIPWRRVTAYMADRGYPCAERGEGAIRGRWKVLRPRLYIVPPPVVRGAAAKSQMKARERETVGREDGEGGAEEEEEDGEADAEGEDALEGEMEVDPKEPEQPQAGEEHGPDMPVDVEGDTTVEEDEVPPRPQRKAAALEKQQNTPTAPTSVLPGNQQPNAPSAPLSDGAMPTSNLRGEVPAAPRGPTVYNTSPIPPLPPNLPHTSPNSSLFALPKQTLLRSPAARIANQLVPQSPSLARPDLPAPSQPHTSPIPTHRSPRESRFYAHPSATSRLSDHPVFQPDPPFIPPTHSPKALSPIRHPPSPDRQTLPPLSSQLLSPTHRLPPHGYSGHLAEDRHLPLPREGPLLSSPGSRHLTQPPPLPLPQQYSPAPVWPARVERVYDDNPFDEQSRTRGDRGFHTSGDRGYSTSPERAYPASGERDRGHHASPGREYQTSSERERYAYEGTRPRKGRKPEMLPFPVTNPTRQRETPGTGTFSTFSTTTPATFQSSFQTSPFQAQSQGSPYQASSQAAQVFSPPPLYVPPLFTTQELAPSGSRLPMLGERTPPRPARESSSRRARGADASARRDSKRKVVDEPRRTRQATYERQSSSQGSGLSEVADSTAGDNDL